MKSLRSTGVRDGLTKVVREVVQCEKTNAAVLTSDCRCLTSTEMD